MKTSLYESIEVDLDKNIANIKNRISGKIGEIVTNNLERLVETFREAKTILPPEDFNELTIRIVGGGIVKLSQYFKRITQVALGENYCVIYGGAYFKGRYGNGFKFVFFDKIENKSISLYISPEIMEKYRFSFRRYIEE